MLSAISQLGIQTTPVVMFTIAQIANFESDRVFFSLKLMYLSGGVLKNILLSYLDACKVSFLYYL